MSGARIEIRPAGGKDSAASDYGGITADLLPGAYDVTISGVTIPGVEVRSRSDSKIAVGALRVSAGASRGYRYSKASRLQRLTTGRRSSGFPQGPTKWKSLDNGRQSRSQREGSSTSDSLDADPP